MGIYNLKPNRKLEHLFAIVRCDTHLDQICPLEQRITVKKVVSDAHYAEAEVKRLNDLNADKGAVYFCQVTRFEEALSGVPPAPELNVNDNVSART